MSQEMSIVEVRPQVFTKRGETVNHRKLNAVAASLVLAFGAGASPGPLAGSAVQWGGYQIPNVSEGTRILSMSSGYESAFVVTSEGTAAGWGWNTYGETATPPELSNVVAVSVDTHTVALKADGTVMAWGDNSSGATNVPPGLSNVVMVSTQCGHTVALKADGTVVAWGDNFCGESSVPAWLSNVVVVAAGCCSTFALRADGTGVYIANHTNFLIADLTNVVAVAPNYGVGGAAWMIKSDGSVLYSHLTSDWVFTNEVVAGLSNIVAVSGGDRAGGVLALQRDGTVLNFAGLPPVPCNATAIAVGGGGEYALQADGNVIEFGPYFIPQAPLWAKTRELVAIADTMGLRPDGRVVPWGANPDYNTTATLSNVTAISEGYGHCLALRTGGTVFAWGDDSDGQTNVPAGLSNVVAIAAGGYHNLALKSDGSVVGWGYNWYGQASGGGLSGVAAIAAGAGHSLALLSNSTVRAWGYNGQGQLNVPFGLTNVTAIAAGGAHNLALKSDGTIVAWGYNNHGQTDVPPGLSNAVAIAAGGDHSLALKSDGTIVAWGSNDRGESTIPSGLGPAFAISAGFADSMALVLPAAPELQASLSPDGLVVCWPTNYDGFSLQSSPTLSPPNWADCTNAPAIAGPQFYVTNTLFGTPRFFSSAQMSPEMSIVETRPRFSPLSLTDT